MVSERNSQYGWMVARTILKEEWGVIKDQNALVNEKLSIGLTARVRREKPQFYMPCRRGCSSQAEYTYLHMRQVT